MTETDTPPPPSEFLITKEYRRFAEFCTACRQQRYIGLCHGIPGVGKTLSAWQYAQWHLIQPYFPERFYDGYRLRCIEGIIAKIIVKNLALFPLEMKQCRSILYTPAITNTPKRVEQEIHALRLALSYLVEVVRSGPWDELTDDLAPHRMVPDPTDLIIVDEADRLKTATLEQVRDIYDHGQLGVILIGMPGLEKRLSRYPQLYSRVGFVHEFHALSNVELDFILQHKWRELGLPLSSDDLDDVEVMAAIARITHGNFRLLQRLFSQIQRILEINHLSCVTVEVVQAARDSLVIGPT